MQRLLVAGDNDDANRVHDCLRANYTRRGCSVLFCPTPGELLRHVQKSSPDAIFMHFQFAELTVYEIYQQIRALPEGRTLPIMVLETEMLGGTTSPTETLVLLKMPLTVSHLIRRCSAVLHQDVATQDPSVLCEPTFMQSEEDEGEADAVLAEERRLQLLREHSIRLRGEEMPKEQVYLIPEHVRRRWFYNSDFVQGLFDRIEDSAWYQARCRRKYGGAAPAEPAPEPAETAEEEMPEEGPRTWRPPEPQPAPTEARRQKRTGGGNAPLLLLPLLALLIAGGAVFMGARWLLLTETICPQCGHRAEQPVLNIHNATCEECGGNVGFACKCKDCKHEFSFVPGLDVKTRFGATQAPPCPECGSTKTVRLGK